MTEAPEKIVTSKNGKQIIDRNRPKWPSDVVYIRKDIADAAYERGRRDMGRAALAILNDLPKKSAMSVILALIPDAQEPEVMHDDAPRAIIGEIGNQIHNLGCEVQGNERLSEALADLASRAWKAAQMVSSEPDTQEAK